MEYVHYARVPWMKQDPKWSYFVITGHDPARVTIFSESKQQD